MIALKHLGIESRDDVLGVCFGGNCILIISLHNVLESAVLSVSRSGGQNEKTNDEFFQLMKFLQFIQGAVFNHLHERENEFFSIIAGKGLNGSLLFFN